MKNITIKFFLFFSTILFSQEEIRILESYIIENKELKSVSNRSLDNSDLINAINYFLEDELLYDEEMFELITSNFDFKNISLNNDKFHAFHIKSNKRKYKSVRFSTPILSENGSYAIIYSEEKCKKGLCGGGSLILLEKVNNNWKKKRVLYAWIG